jgi:hypothetical protein
VVVWSSWQGGGVTCGGRRGVYAPKPRPWWASGRRGGEGRMTGGAGGAGRACRTWRKRLGRLQGRGMTGGVGALGERPADEWAWAREGAGRAAAKN